MVSLHSKNNSGTPLRIVEISRVVRQMRGGSQSRLVVGDDGCYYVAKFLGNPQGNRTIINEWIASKLTRSLGIATPEMCLLGLSEAICQRDNITFSTGSRCTGPQGALHLGSKCPVNPEKVSIFDIFPSKLSAKLINIDDFGAMFVIDKWLHSVDRRQAIFYRDRSVTSTCVYRADFVDFGMAFGGQRWELLDVPLHGLADSSGVYRAFDISSIAGATVEAIQEIKPTTLESTMTEVPTQWFEPGDQKRLTELAMKLDQRRSRLGDLVQRHLLKLKLHS